MEISSAAKAFVWTKAKVTEQANVVSILVTMMAAATCYGWIEGTLYPYYPYRNQLEVFGRFTWYHTVMLGLFIVVAFSISISRMLETGLRKWYLPAASFGSAAWGFWIEDMAYFATIRYNPCPCKREGLNSTAWVNWILGGHTLFGLWIPNTYILLCAGGFALFAIAFVVSRKDLVLKMKLAPKKVGKLTKVAIGLPFLVVTEIVGIIGITITDLEVSIPVQVRLSAIFLVSTVPTILVLILTDWAVRHMSESV
ncbi:MAG: hypothetical protein NTX81_01905 [Candidatus Bathyarchaeota archaeon]|nr:hypothetical protein [Candidatus Bathyarchaeota archaeon]